MKKLIGLLLAVVMLGCSEDAQSPVSYDVQCHKEDVTVQVVRKDSTYLSNELQSYLEDPSWSCKLGMVTEWLSIAPDGTIHVFVSEVWDCTMCDSW